MLLSTAQSFLCLRRFHAPPITPLPSVDRCTCSIRCTSALLEQNTHTFRRQNNTQLGGRFKWGRSPPNTPPRPPTYLQSFAADMPAIASSKDKLNAVLDLVGIKAAPGQIDRLGRLLFRESRVCQGRAACRKRVRLLERHTRKQSYGEDGGRGDPSGSLAKPWLLPMHFLHFGTDDDTLCARGVAKGSHRHDGGDGQVVVMLGIRSGDDRECTRQVEPGRAHERSLSDDGDSARIRAIEWSARVLRCTSSSPQRVMTKQAKS